MKYTIIIDAPERIKKTFVISMHRRQGNRRSVLERNIET